ncbi:hypothetical protein CASFOL_010185 [Castilleja foliolosa]|uniref:Uncharacterized protein n=1 Tax=Castilleja foliolosa TaxID=1961234 RepID=A0ABD3DS02_9LAMI
MADGGEIQFAEPIIHRLQSFLTGKEAAQTTIISKSWYSAWLTRPNLDLDDTYFGISSYKPDHSKLDAFKKYAKKTIKRYEQSNLKIESFKLCMDINQYGCADLANKLIMKALRNCATRLCLRLNRSSSFVLTHEVFGADSTNIDTIFNEEIQISNCSIELIKLVLKGFGYTKGRKPRVKFDVPSVRKFTFEGDAIPSLSFISTPPSREWESHLSIECAHRGLSAFWFNELSELLTELSQSKTHLSLHIERNAASSGYEVSNSIIQGLHKHELENLTIDMKDLPTLSCYAFFDGLFRVCRPKLITEYYVEDPDERRNYPRTSITFLCQTLKEGINFKVSSPTQFMYGLNDLEEVNVQAFDMDNVPAEWRPIPFDEHVHEHQRVRLLLKWKSN